MELAFLSPVSYNNHLPGAGELHTRKALYHSDCRKTDPAVLLRNFVRSCEPEAFLIITNSSEVVGKGFLLE